ncbi:ER lumen protein-retaining receptor [Panicum miliaceum]|uniref:ER lumen protein-retaining receptor n=1 Tax=Panicum miliaceum TaxID=4540 RepID=A0A3L6PUY0_PANMI|nr:ER lumen protein-retaining receptor [Panicum miliaceum]
MNAFRLAGDMTHLISVLVLLLKIHTIKSCAGVSLKTQELYALVFSTRYLDIFTDFISLYNTVMKLIFLGSSFSIVWYMRHHKLVQRSYDKDHDTFRHQFLVLPCLILALLIHEQFTFKEQLVRIDMVSVRKNPTMQPYCIPWISGFVQTLLYADFFYYYINRLFEEFQSLQKIFFSNSKLRIAGIAIGISLHVYRRRADRLARPRTRVLPTIFSPPPSIVPSMAAVMRQLQFLRARHLVAVDRTAT